MGIKIGYITNAIKIKYWGTKLKEKKSRKWYKKKTTIKKISTLFDIKTKQNQIKKRMNLSFFKRIQKKSIPIKKGP